MSGANCGAPRRSSSTSNFVHEYRKFPFVDPGLPRELLPSDWVGTTAHAIFLQSYELLREPALAYYETVAEATDPRANHAGIELAGDDR